MILLCTNQLLINCLSLLPPADFHVDLVAGVFQFHLKCPPLCLGLRQHLFTGNQVLISSQPLLTALLKVYYHLQELCMR